MWRPWSPRRSKDHSAGPTTALSFLASFVSAGLTSGLAWKEVANLCPEDPVVQAIVHDLDAGTTLGDAIALHTREASVWWQLVGVCWAIVRETGSPAGPALQALADALRDTDNTLRDIESALVGPTQTIRLVSFLPLIAVIAGLLGGAEHAFLLVSTVAGGAVLGVAGALMAGAIWWLRLLRESALPAEGEVTLELDIFAAASRGGMLPERARGCIVEQYELRGIPLRYLDELDRLVDLSRRAGVPVSHLATQHSQQLRRQVALAAKATVDTMEVRVALPLGILVLPAFVLVSIAPFLLGLAPLSPA